jgi:hypothetical protein
MPFSGVKNRTSERFNEVQIFLNYISSLETDSSSVIPLELKIMKGLFYVHLYSAFEKSINEVIETCLLLIASKNVRFKHFSPTLLSIALSDKVKSLVDSNHQSSMTKSAEIFEASISQNIANINETALSNKLQNVWVKTINEVVKILGMEEVMISAQMKITINEIVDKRNAVAHGRDSAASIGERFRANELRDRLNLVSSATHIIIDSIEVHCEKMRYIKPSARRLYS